MIEFKVVLFTISKYTLITWVGSESGSAWIQNFCLDPDPEFGKFRAGSGSGINHLYHGQLRRETLVPGSTGTVLLALAVYFVKICCGAGVDGAEAVITGTW